MDDHIETQGKSEQERAHIFKKIGTKNLQVYRNVKANDTVKSSEIKKINNITQMFY